MRQCAMGLFLTCFLVLGGVLTTQAIAQEETDYSWGTVVEVTDQSITIEQYDYETDGYSQVSYTLGANIALENIESVKDIKPGDEVEIGFIMKDDTKTVVSLYLEKIEDPQNELEYE